MGPFRAEPGPPDLECLGGTAHFAFAVPTAWNSVPYIILWLDPSSHPGKGHLLKEVLPAHSE